MDSPLNLAFHKRRLAVREFSRSGPDSRNYIMQFSLNCQRRAYGDFRLELGALHLPAVYDHNCQRMAGMREPW